MPSDCCQDPGVTFRWAGEEPLSAFFDDIDVDGRSHPSPSAGLDPCTNPILEFSLGVIVESD